MKQTITRYFCDRCGAEFEPYGAAGTMTGNYGIVFYARGKMNFAPTDATGKEHFFERHGKGTLCPDCLDGLINYLNKKEI